MLTFKVDDLSGLLANLRALAVEYEEGVRELNRSTAPRALATALQIAPKDTGYSASKLKMEFSDDGLRWTVGWDAADFIGHINPFDGRLITSFYVVPVEYGSTDSPAQPTLEPTLASVGPEYLAALQKLTEESVRRHNRKTA